VTKEDLEHAEVAETLRAARTKRHAGFEMREVARRPAKRYPGRSGGAEQTLAELFSLGVREVRAGKYTAVIRPLQSMGGRGANGVKPSLGRCGRAIAVQTHDRAIGPSDRRVSRELSEDMVMAQGVAPDLRIQRLRRGLVQPAHGNVSTWVGSG
jgi:hypothetical protein